MRCISLMPVGILKPWLAQLIQPASLLIAQLQLCRGQIVFELRLTPPTDDNGRDAGAAEKPRQCHLCRGYATAIADLDQELDDVPKAFLITDRRFRPSGELARSRGRLLIAPMLARE